MEEKDKTIKELESNVEGLLLLNEVLKDEQKKDRETINKLTDMLIERNEYRSKLIEAHKAAVDANIVAHKRIRELEKLQLESV